MEKRHWQDATENKIKDEIESKIAYRFKSRHWLRQALIHSSYANEHKMNPLDDNERLEFLGDAVLELTVSEYIFNTYPELSEGELTKLRASVVCEPMLAKAARTLGLGGFIHMGRGEDQSGGRNRDSILSDALEAVIGAVYKDGGFAPAQAFILRLLGTEIGTMRSGFQMSDCKTFLQEQLQQTSKAPIEYTVIGENGPDHNKSFVVQVRHDGRVLGKGEGKNKKEAEQNAALDAIQALHLR